MKSAAGFYRCGALSFNLKQVEEIDEKFNFTYNIN